jgi:hypothetical protein
MMVYQQPNDFNHFISASDVITLNNLRPPLCLNQLQ